MEIKIEKMYQNTQQQKMWQKKEKKNPKTKQNKKWKQRVKQFDTYVVSRLKLYVLLYEFMNEWTYMYVRICAHMAATQGTCFKYRHQVLCHSITVIIVLCLPTNCLLEDACYWMVLVTGVFSFTKTIYIVAIFSDCQFCF